MWKKAIGWAAISALMGIVQSGQAQNGFRSGFYQIAGGQYSECCGIAGAFDYSLPDENQGFVELILEPGGHTARMTFLGPDMFTVFSSYPWLTGSGFAFSFNDGIVFPDHIQFGSGIPAPSPGLASWNYTVSNAAGGLRINGVAVTPRFGADLPNRFQHTNVGATLVPGTVVIDRVEKNGGTMGFHFTGPPPYDYAVEFTDSLSTPQWQTLGSYRAKLKNIDIVVTNSVTNAATRFFRIRQEPCGCR